MRIQTPSQMLDLYDDVGRLCDAGKTSEAFTQVVDALGTAGIRVLVTDVQKPRSRQRADGHVRRQDACGLALEMAHGRLLALRRGKQGSADYGLIIANSPPVGATPRGCPCPGRG